MSKSERPREFNRQEVLDKAMNACWSKGYEACSTEDLCSSTGLRLPFEAIYHTNGYDNNKLDIIKDSDEEAVSYYAKRSRRPIDVKQT